MELTAVTLAVNVTLLSPEAIVTLPGTLTLELPLARVTAVALEAGTVSVTAQAEVAGPVTLAGEQLKLLN